jgi:hypothetical protein
MQVLLRTRLFLQWRLLSKQILGIIVPVRNIVPAGKTILGAGSFAGEV